MMFSFLLAALAASIEPATTLCQASVEFGPKVVALCRVPAANVARVYRFETVFEGGHDDTRAALLARRAGSDLDCETGSKPELDGEFGTVRLVCRVTVAASLEPTALDFEVTWYHAEYSHVEFHAE